jgi:hypothetical protein
MRFAVALALLGLLAASLAGSAVTKEDGRAELTTAPPLSARPGSVVTVAWIVRVGEGRGASPFGAGAMFVQLLSRTGGAMMTASTETGTGAVNTVNVRVPAGGVGGVRVGLHGTRCDAAGCRPAPVFFPVTNDPFTSSGGIRCDVEAFRQTFAAFVRAANRGDGEQLDALFSRKRFAWYSHPDPGARLGGESGRRDTLVPDLLRRYGAGDRLRLVSYRFNGYEPGRGLGHFSITVERRSGDPDGGGWVRVPGKGALDCSSSPVSLAVLSLGG